MIMELLQSGRYKDNPEQISEFYLHDLKLQIEQIIELCKEGELSVFETSNIILAEEYSCRDFQNNLLKMLTNLEDGAATLPSYCNDNKEIWIQLYKDNISMTLDDIKEYQIYIIDVLLNKLTIFIENYAYLENRRIKIKQKIIQEGLSSVIKNYQNSIPTTNEAPEIFEKIFNSIIPDDNYFLKMLKNEYPTAYTAVKNGITAGIIEYKNTRFNFKCDKGCVGLVFSEAGCTEYKKIRRYILINGEEPAENTLKNCKKNVQPKEWERIKTIFFNNLKTTPE